MKTHMIYKSEHTLLLFSSKGGRIEWRNKYRTEKFPRSFFPIGVSVRVQTYMCVCREGVEKKEWEKQRRSYSSNPRKKCWLSRKRGRQSRKKNEFHHILRSTSVHRKKMKREREKKQIIYKSRFSWMNFAHTDTEDRKRERETRIPQG